MARTKSGMTRRRTQIRHRQKRRFKRKKLALKQKRQSASTEKDE